MNSMLLRFQSEVSHLISCEMTSMHKHFFCSLSQKSQVTFAVRRTMLTASEMSKVSQGKVNSVHASTLKAIK